MTLDVGEDRIVLETTGRATFYLDIDLAYYVSNSDVGAQFNRKTKVRWLHKVCCMDFNACCC